MRYLMNGRGVLSAAAWTATLACLSSPAFSATVTVLERTDTRMVQSASGVQSDSGILRLDADTSGIGYIVSDRYSRRRNQSDRTVFAGFDESLGTLDTIEVFYEAREIVARSGLTSSSMSYTTNLTPGADIYREMIVRTDLDVGIRGNIGWDVEIGNYRKYKVDGRQTVLSQDGTDQTYARRVYIANISEFDGVFSPDGTLRLTPYLDVLALAVLTCSTLGTITADITDCHGEGSYSAEHHWELSVTYNYTPAAVVPLPATALLLAGALGGLGALAARRRR